MRRKIISIRNAKSIGCIEQFTYNLSCGHRKVGDLRRWEGRVQIHPKATDCAQCAC